jgi:hypothetical protein
VLFVHHQDYVNVVGKLFAGKEAARYPHGAYRDHKPNEFGEFVEMVKQSVSMVVKPRVRAKCR